MSNVRSGPRNFFRLFIMERLLGKCSGQNIALDAGCGDGSLSLRLLKKGFQVYAVDADQESCQTLKDRAVSLNCAQRLNVRCSVLEDIDFPASSFDIVVCGEVLEHLDNEIDVLKKFHALLKKEGVLVLSVPMKGKGWDLWDETSGHKRLYDYDDLVSLLEKAGFRVEKSFSWGYPFLKFYHRNVFMKWATKAGGAEEVWQEKMVSTRIGKSRILSVVVGYLFLLDVFFTPRRRGIGVALRARKI